jgi:diguanylate cyclase (GGDEF)-like protein/PAS domain S-box-containing protein
VSAPLLAALERGDGEPAPDANGYLAIAEIVSLEKRLAGARATRADEADELARRLEEREAAYAQLHALSERLEERLELRGAELEERNFSLSVAERHYREAVDLATDIVFTLDLEGRFTAVNAAGERFFGRPQPSLIGRHWRRTLAPGFDAVDAAEGESSLLEQLFAGSPRTATTVHAAADGEMRILSTRMELVRDEDGLPLNMRCVARDVTEVEGFQRQVGELGRRLEAVQRASQRRDRELNALLSAARAINSELEIDQLLQHIIESAAAQIHAESGFVGLLDEGALTLNWYWRSSGGAWFDQHAPRVERGVTQVVMRTRQPYFCADAAADPQTDKEFTTRFGVRSMLVMPIFDQASELLGAMALHNFPAASQAGDAAIDPSDMRFLEGLSDIAAAAVQQSKLLERVTHQAETDPLSGLFNRRAFEARLEEELHRAARFGRTFSLVLVDIDHLKTINDTYGHPIGDAAICAVADVLQSRLRRHDFAARIGGEEFAVLIVEARPEQAVIAAKSLCDAIRKRPVPRAGRFTASLGVASYPEDATTRDALIDRADEALYAAKRSGRDRVMHVRDVTPEPPDATA